MFDNPQHIPLTLLHDSLFEEKGVEVYIKREDMIHPNISGNKWRKLKYNFIEAKEQGFDTILTFGGAFSNHIHATAAAGKKYGFKTIGIIRGEKHLPLNSTLDFAQECGMQLQYMDRETYRRKTDEDIIQTLRNKYGEVYVVPEGGTSALAIKGVAELVSEIEIDFTHVCTACGTGGTLAGVITGLAGEKVALGFSALKGTFLKEEVQKFVSEDNWHMETDYHFGGYAKLSRELVLFMKEFENQHNTPIEPIYTAKMFYGLYDMIRKDRFQRGSKIVAIHTGGLQGLKGMQEKIEQLKSH